MTRLFPNRVESLLISGPHFCPLKSGRPDRGACESSRSGALDGPMERVLQRFLLGARLCSRATPESTVFRAVCGLTWLTAAARQQKLLRCGPMQLEEGGGHCHWAERNQPRQRCNAMSEGRKRHMWGPSARSGPQELNLCCHVVRQCIPCV